MVLWDPNFTPEDAHYLLSFKENETKTSFVKEVLGQDFPDEANTDPVLQLVSEFDHTEAWVADWETFLATANSDQTEYVQSIIRFSQMMQVVDQRKSEPIDINLVWDLLPETLKRLIAGM